MEFLDALESGEVSGNMGRAMEVLAREYEERTKVYMRGLTVAASMTVFFIVAGIIIFMIFNMVSIYLNPINKALGR